MKPIIVIVNKRIHEFSDIENAEAVALTIGGDTYRLEHYYQEKCKQVDMLIEMLDLCEEKGKWLTGTAREMTD